MKKILIIIFALFLISGCSSKNTTQNSLPKQVNYQIENYKNYREDVNDFKRLLRGEKLVYYLGLNNKKFVFPTESTFKTWFPNSNKEAIALSSMSDLEKYPVGGNVTCRPGTLLKTITVPDTFYVTEGGIIRPFINETLISQIFGQDWNNSVIDLPNEFFNNYTIGETIKNISDFPIIGSTSIEENIYK